LLNIHSYVTAAIKVITVLNTDILPKTRDNGMHTTFERIFASKSCDYRWRQNFWDCHKVCFGTHTKQLKVKESATKAT